MTLEPQTIEPGYSKRWIKSTFELIFRSFHFYMTSILITAAVVSVASKYAYPIYIVMCLIFVAHFAKMAELANNSTLNISTYLQSFRQATETAIAFFKNQIYVFMSVIIIGGFFIFILDTKETSFFNNTFDFLFSATSPLAVLSVSAMLGIGLPAVANKFSGQTYFLFDKFGIKPTESYPLLFKATTKNMYPAIFVDLTALVFAFVGVFIPIAGVLFFGFLSFMHYIVFNEMFLGESGLKKEKEVIKMSPLPATTTN